MPDGQPPHEPHLWAELTPEQVLDALIYELYPPISALGDEIDRLTTGAFDDEELTLLLDQMQAGVNQLSRLVVALKRYTAERRAAGDRRGPEPA